MSESKKGVRFSSTALLVLNAAAAALLVDLAWHGTEATQLLQTAPKALAPLELDIDPGRPRVELGALQEEPLLYANRRFYAPPPPGAVPTAPPRPDYKLVGTFVIPSKPTVALLSGPGGLARKVKPGDDLEGWSVTAVEGGRVILRYQSETIEITNSAKAGGPGMQMAPLSRTAQSSPSGGIRTLGMMGPGTPPGAPASYPTSNQSARLYRPPPK
jgi:hypothetical protein